MEQIVKNSSNNKFVSFKNQPIFKRSLITEINRRLASETSYQKLLDFIFDSLDQVLPCDRIGVALIEGHGENAQLSLKWLRSKSTVNHLNLSYSAKIQGSSLEEMLNSGTPRIISDLVNYAANHPDSLSTRLILEDGIKSNLTCPLSANNRQIGAVFFSSFTPNAFQQNHIDIFLEIADELATIVDHLSLRRDLEVCVSHAKNLNMIIHDLKSPLSTIKGFAELSLDRPWFRNLPQEGRDVFQIFLRNSKTMFDLLNDLLEVAQLDKRAEPFISEDVNLKEFLEEALANAIELAKIKETAVLPEISTNLPIKARFDRRQVLRVLTNLFSNAVKFSEAKSHITFAVSCARENLLFSVTDCGAGIPASEIPKLFREFGKTSVRPTNGETSTGLGLAIAKKIVERHEGSISVASEVGKGSTFSFSIPLSAIEKFEP